MTPNSFVKNLTIIHSVLIVGLLSFAGVTLYLNKDKMNFTFSSEDIFVIVFPVIVISALTMSRIVPVKMLQNAKKTKDLKRMLAQYQTASIVQYILIEGPAMFGIVLFLITFNATFIAISGVLVVYLILQRPTKTKIENDLELRGELRNQFMKYDEVID